LSGIVTTIRKTSDLTRLLSGCLNFQPSPQLIEGARSNVRDPVVWSKLIDRAFAHHVAPLFFRRTVRSGLLDTAPAELAEFLAVTDRLNLGRNATILQEMIELAETLERLGISPIALKGGALLLDNDLPEHNAVMLSDLDLLVRADEVQRAISAAASLGYRASSAAPGGHSVVLWHPDRIASIDLHHDLGPQRHVLAAAEADGRAERAGAFPLRRLSPTDRAIHNIYHAQIQNRNYRLAILSLHQLCNLGLLIESHGNRIDWDFVRRQFERCGYTSHFMTYLYLAERLLGIRTSARLKFGRREAMHLNRVMLQMDWPWLHNLVTYPALLNSGRTEDRIAYKQAKGLPIQNAASAMIRLGFDALRRHRHMVFAKVAAVHRSQFGRR
jgi:hypothetical protein